MADLGRHILVEFTQCDPEVLNDVILIEQGMVNGAKEAGATVINSTFHHFSPFGVSGVVVIQESHLAIHTWPEYRYAAVDLFTCGDEVNPWISFDFLKDVLKSTSYGALEMRRGNLNLLEKIEFDLGSMREEAKKHVNPGMYNRNVWFTDKDDNQALSLRHTGEILFDRRTPYQHVRVLQTYAYGKMLAIDNMVMCTEKDECHYHEMITHPAIFTHGKVKHALVIGGGDGGTVREILKHKEVEQVTMVEIDEAVVDASKQLLPTISSAFGHPKLNLIIGDGIRYVKEAADHTFDLIIVDGSDPVGPAEGLFSMEFYQHCHRILKPDGILAGQTESPVFNDKAFSEINQLLKELFGDAHVHVITYSQPTYPTGTWSIMIARKDCRTPMDVDNDVIASFIEENPMGFYNTEMHYAGFALPNYVKKLLNEL
ncbi:MAG TPA: polyamine aminopropyltransferase [Bacteroidales bacterium]|nr:polyamine aminopropyltransferase [Bacteroidales bacterium]HRZ48334.1 polyamine aminopropyltransferase [Bacteroidales bacterium]